MRLCKIQIFQKRGIFIEKENQTTTELDFMVCYLSNGKSGDICILDKPDSLFSKYSSWATG